MIKFLFHIFYTNMRQIISIGVGSFGVRVQQKIWKQLARQHHINEQGLSSNETNSSQPHCVFHEQSEGNFIPRAVVADLEPDQILEIKRQKSLLNKNKMHLIQQGASGNYIIGHYTICRKIFQLILQQIRKQTERCDTLSGFLLHSAIYGGSSGLNTKILQHLNTEYPKRQKVQLSLFPSPNNCEAGPVQSYNSLLSFQSLNKTTFQIILDNQQLYKICQRYLDIEQPSYNEINEIVANISCQLTWTQRFTNSLNSDFNMLATNLINQKRLNLLTCSSTNYRTATQKPTHNCLNASQLIKMTLKNYSLLSSNKLQKGTYLSSFLNFKGLNSSQSIRRSVDFVLKQSHLKFGGKFPYRVKIGYNVPEYCSIQQPLSLFHLSNHTSVRHKINRITQKYDIMYEKRAFVHWYVGQGLSQGFFSEARQTAQYIKKSYQQAEDQQLVMEQVQ